MREIKFRGKRVDNGEWVYGYYFPDMLKKTHDSTVTWAFIKEYDYENAKSITQEVHKETVGQYTGLKDKNGKEIYEGDILKCKSTKSTGDGYFNHDITTFYRNSVVEWWQSFSNIGYRLRSKDGSTMMIKPSSLSKMEVEVIGNIFQDGDLLRDSQSPETN